MARRVRRIALVVIALAVIAGIALVLTGRATLNDERDRVDERWVSLRGPLAARYAELDAVLIQLEAADAGDRDVTRALARELERWNELQQATGADVDTGAEVTTADALEGLYARALRAVESSARLRTDAELTAALGRFAAATPPPQAVNAYNAAAETYQTTREELRYSLTTRLFGYDTRPALALATEAPAPGDEAA